MDYIMLRLAEAKMEDIDRDIVEAVAAKAVRQKGYLPVNWWRGRNRLRKWHWFGKTDSSNGGKRVRERYETQHDIYIV